MSETRVSHEFVDNFNMDVAVVRHIGSVRNVSVEIWSSKERNQIVLVVSPTVSGFTILAFGTPSEAAVLANVGLTVLQAMAGVLPLAVGDFFRGAAARATDVQPPRRVEPPEAEAVSS